LRNLKSLTRGRMLKAARALSITALSDYAITKMEPPWQFVGTNLR
jgi:hypothetical protein